MAAKSMTDVAFDYLVKKKSSVKFLKLWEEVQKVFAFPENRLQVKKTQFYSELMLDNRFASLDDNHWDLRNRRKFDELYIDTSLLSIEDGDEEESDAEAEE